MMRYLAFSATLIHTIFSFGQNDAYKAVIGIFKQNFQHNFKLSPNANSTLVYIFEGLLLNKSIDTSPYLFITPQFNSVCRGGFVLSHVIN